ncbi:MAG TPA: tRNA dihydrouridine(20/20a) synthase DusA [Burkholderiales bacterium]|nr:tRNA dihydrouridine(20/20a) synthase DusA [Burkholderiales bacterium]
MSAHRVCVAPMMDWSDRHYRYFMRQVNASAFLYTEMITTGALIHGDVPRHLDFSQEEHPVGLQLGGSEPEDLAHCARLGEKWGYDEINLNIGCPSERVQRGAFGACLMAEPQLVSECVRRMKDEVGIAVSVKHRTGVDAIETYEFLKHFVETVAKAGCRTFIVHARNAILKGLSPKENREIPPLKYDYVYRLKRDFPELEIVINGGIVRRQEIDPHLMQVDGVMLGRAAYHDPWVLADAGKKRADVVTKMFEYCRDFPGESFSLRSVARHMLGLYHGMPRARLWRRKLSDAALLAKNDPGLLLETLEAVEGGIMEAA